jgi:signal peptidase I
VRGKQKSASGSLLELLMIVVVALGLALLIQGFLVKPYRIPTPSMEPTLEIGQRVLVNRLGNRFGPPSVGDVVVFHPPASALQDDGLGPEGQCRVQPAPGQPCPVAGRAASDQNFIKRVVAGPGDTVAIVNGHVLRNGRRVSEPFIRPCATGDGCDFRTPIRVPAGQYFMMGDNRGSSDDSRYWGPVPRSWIIGGAFATYWPVDRIGLL